jgi:hypothetical protein
MGYRTQRTINYSPNLPLTPGHSREKLNSRKEVYKRGRSYRSSSTTLIVEGPGGGPLAKP